MEFADWRPAPSCVKQQRLRHNLDYLKHALFLSKQSVKQVILCFFPGNYPSRALFLMKQSVKQVILCFFLGNAVRASVRFYRLSLRLLISDLRLVNDLGLVLFVGVGLTVVEFKTGALIG